MRLIDGHGLTSQHWTLCPRLWDIVITLELVWATHRCLEWGTTRLSGATGSGWGDQRSEEIIMSKPTTGRLVAIPGCHYECVDCRTIYPEDTERPLTPTITILCNNTIITLCPWCRPDTEPFKNGRGIWRSIVTLEQDRTILTKERIE